MTDESGVRIMKYLLSLFCVFIVGTSYADMNDMQFAIANVKKNCIGISDELSSMKRLAGISTAVTSVGTATGAGALITGIVKSNKDKEIASYEQALELLYSMKNDSETLDYISVPIDKDLFIQQMKNYINNAIDIYVDKEINSVESQKSELEQRSKQLGNIRTGLIATDAATHIAGAITSGKNKVKGDLKSQIDNCIASVKNLNMSRQQGRIDGSATQQDLDIADKIIKECGQWQYVNIDKINNKANTAMISSIVGTVGGIAGTVTSASANSEKVRNMESDTKEKNLNTASNILAGTTAGASLVSTVFNASQISVIKKAADVADKCEGVLK